MTSHCGKNSVNRWFQLGNAEPMPPDSSHVDVQTGQHELIVLVHYVKLMKA